MLHAFIDFETRSRADLKKCGQTKYARDESTVVLCLAGKLPGGSTFLWTPGKRIPNRLRKVVVEGGELHAHNASFEKAIWKYVMVPQHGWPDVEDEQWHCTLARCAALALPRSLDQASRALGLA